MSTALTKRNVAVSNPINSTTLVMIIVVALILYFLLKKKTQYNNAETWDIKWNEEGLPETVTVHRNATTGSG